MFLYIKSEKKIKGVKADGTCREKEKCLTDIGTKIDTFNIKCTFVSRRSNIIGLMSLMN